MPVRPLIVFPDPILRQQAVAATSGPELSALAADLCDTLAAVAAIGLTAPHIGILSRLVAVRLVPDGPIRIYANPVLLGASAETEAHDEGSVSMPGMRETVTRPARVRVGYQDLGGASAEEEFSGFAAAVMQHEIDQLDGIFWIQRLSRLKRDRLVTRFAKVQRQRE